MMPIAISYGISIDEYERRTFKEIDIIIEAMGRKEEREFKALIMKDYQMVDLQSASISRLFSKDAKFPKIYDLYPTMFGDLKESAEARDRNIEAQRLSAQWKHYAATHNASIKPKTEVNK